MTTETTEKTASPLELFFDLVFVYAITQVSVLVASDLTAVGYAHGALVLGMLWWAWSQFTWAGNLINVEPRKVRLAIIFAMAPAFVMAQGVSSAFDG
jgi:low temperature requirement protein LtrA